MSRKAGVTVDYSGREARGSGRAVAVEEESEHTDRQPQRDLGVFGGQRTGRNPDRRWWRQGWSPEEEERTIRTRPKGTKRERDVPRQ